MAHAVRNARSRTAVVVIALLAAIALLDGTPARADVNLAPNSGPYFLTAGPDGNVWFTEHDSGEVGSVTTGGQLVAQYTLPNSYSTPYDVVAGSDGALWFSDPINSQIDRVSTAGDISQFDVPPDPLGVTVGPDGATWFAYNGSQPGIGRLATDGALESDFIWPDTDWITGVSWGSDGQLWMTEGQGETCSGCYQDKIGRLDGIDGSYSSWVLPTQPAYPYRIVAGPDGALWFTEATANKIGRITTAGVIREYPLPAGVINPRGITAGPDGALWFTASSDVGRITTTGAITIYPVPGATSLLGIYAAPDGTLWLADQSASKIIHFTPTAVPPPPNGYVALGDSYSSGEANPPFMKPNTGCDRSTDGAWPELVARSLNIRLVALLACSGATTAALANSFKKMPPQLHVLARMNPRPKLVTVTMGGNDLGFTYVLTSCFLSTCSTALAGVEGSFAGGFGKHMTAVYRAIQQRVPGALVVVVGYPQIIPNSPITALRHCPWLKDPADPALMRKVTGQLNGVLARAASRAGVSYVSTLNALKGHELCTAHSWMKAIGPTGGNGRGHPTARGQAALAATVRHYLTSHHLVP